MEPVAFVEGVVAPLGRADVDTDQIIPKQFLKRIERTGYGEFLFHDWRRQRDGSLDPDFVLNRRGYAGARVLAAGRNFGCGSSREHAAWALKDHGFGAVVAPSLADIFRANCFQVGIVPVELAEDEVTALLGRALLRSGYRVLIDVARGSLAGEDGFLAHFELDSFRRRCLLEGLDDIALTLEHEEAISRFEARRRAELEGGQGGG